MATLLSVMAESTKATNTPRMVSPCEARRPSKLPPKRVPKTPTNNEPTNGASGTANRVDTDKVAALMVYCYPLSELSSSTLILDLLRNSRTRIARPMADSAAATVRMKNTKTCP